MPPTTITGFRRALSALMKPTATTDDPDGDAHRENIRAAELRQLASRVSRIGWSGADAEAKRIRAQAIAEANKIDEATAPFTTTYRSA